MTPVETFHQTDRYPGWVFRKTVERNGREVWWGTKLGVGYGVEGYEHNGKFIGELYTRQKHMGSVNWWPIAEHRNPFYGDMKACIEEAERRAAYWRSKGVADPYGDYLKETMPATK